MLSDIFLTSETKDWVIQACRSYAYDPLLVLLSCLVAVFASCTAFHLVPRVSVVRSGRTKAAWLATGSISMGSGIWSMHFIAMLAVSMPAGVHYDMSLTALSVVEIALLAR